MKKVFLLVVLYICYTGVYAQKTDVKAVSTIKDLRGVTGMNVGDVIYVKSHTSPEDGGGGFFKWRNDADLTGTGYFGKDNNGTLIKATANNSGRWVREYNGQISIAYFGVKNETDLTTAFQNAIDFAEQNANDYGTAPTRGRTVFVPSGVWLVSNIIFKKGVDVIGDSYDATVLKAIGAEPYLFEMESGPVKISIANFKILGDNTSNKGCFHFKAEMGSHTSCGLWNSTFKNIEILGFRGHGVFSEAMPSGYLGPNQFLVFENFNVYMSKNAPETSSALKMTGQHGQITFLNSGFNGYNDFDSVSGTNRFHKGSVVEISDTGLTSAVVSFINATFQESQYGLVFNHAENITMDNCWFENLGTSVTVNGTESPCKSINVLNSRFANAAGFGSLSTTNSTNGAIVHSVSSQVTVANNYVLVSEINDQSKDDFFILANDTNEGIHAFGNSFADLSLSKTSGIMQVLKIQDDGVLNVKYNKMVFVDSSPTIINTITSSVTTGETIYIRANGGRVTVNNANNIFLTKRSSLTLKDGEVAGFTKIDAGSEYGIYQLTSLVKASKR